MYMNSKLSYLFLFLCSKNIDLESSDYHSKSASESIMDFDFYFDSEDLSNIEEFRIPILDTAEDNQVAIYGDNNLTVADILLDENITDEDTIDEDTTDESTLFSYDYGLKPRGEFRKYFKLHYLSNLYKKTYKLSSHLLFKQVIVNCLNTFTNSFVSVIWRNKLVFNKSLGLVDPSNLGEKYGYVSIGKKVQQFFLFLKWSKKHSVKYVKINCHGLKRFFRSSMGHLTKLSRQWLWKYRRSLRRYKGWLFKFAKMIKKYGRAPVQTNRQRKRTRWFKRMVMASRKKIIVWRSLNLRWSLPHNGCKVRKRKGKYAFGYNRF